MKWIHYNYCDYWRNRARFTSLLCFLYIILPCLLLKFSESSIFLLSVSHSLCYLFFKLCLGSIDYVYVILVCFLSTYLSINFFWQSLFKHLFLLTIRIICCVFFLITRILRYNAHWTSSYPTLLLFQHFNFNC